ncbi:aconitate hydratase AcnA [Egibacter rhizosphaerae]|uniref:Aconitate hydratase n=1 Tax=Egibacter rhizosphaerae TaxID=1670831 RepID=A0A411YAP3_9ACTN|nr:aconitate hydratase AcnA [Egibacter rhizosphaerae]QBI18271.1 aconitate hydratase AcnA [Egibacter rhizosphaerae]
MADDAARPADSFGSVDELRVDGERWWYCRLDAIPGTERLPFCLKVLLENLLRHEDGRDVTAATIRRLADWSPEQEAEEVRFTPGRVLLHDTTGVPAAVDLAAVRDALAELGDDPTAVETGLPAHLVIDHSIPAAISGVPDAFLRNATIELERNGERYRFLKWAQQAFGDLRVVPPNTGIMHQVNLEYLADVVTSRHGWAFPDATVGADSHTTMINGLGVLAWGVGGIEAEAAMLGEAISMTTPSVVGFELSGALPEGATATDLVLTITEQLRDHGVVGKFVEFHGPGVSQVPLATRATIGNMSPEYGSTAAIFPIDEETLRYLEFTGRDPAHVRLVEAYARAQGLFHDPDRAAVYSEHLSLDLGTVEPSLAGPSRPQDRVRLSVAKRHAGEVLPSSPAPRDPASRVITGDDSPEAERAPVTLTDGRRTQLTHGDVVIAAITSCTNTSNPEVMVGAGLVARNATRAGLARQPWVKTSLAPGSKVVMDYYERAGLLPHLEELGFHLVGYGCTTCIGQSGDLLDGVAETVRAHDLTVASVLSGNRNFEDRIHPDCRLNYLASPPLVVAYALAGTVHIDLYREPLGHDPAGEPVYLADLWPTHAEIDEVTRTHVTTDLFRERYADIFSGDGPWREVDAPPGARFAWDPDSTYVRRPPFLDGVATEPAPPADIVGARALLKLGDSVTTDHISPAGAIPAESPAAGYLADRGVRPVNFNVYASRRGNHEVMLRGAFSNPRLRNELAPGTEGGVTTYLPSGEQLSIYEAHQRYAGDAVPLIVLAGRLYGSGSSRDWAAKATRLLGVRAVLAESFERIHRSNLVGMGVLPLELPQPADALGLSGTETFGLHGLDGWSGEPDRAPTSLQVTARSEPDEEPVRFPVRVRLDTPKEADYYAHGGILPYALRRLHARDRARAHAGARARSTGELHG